MARTPGATSLSPSYCLMFFQVGNTAWMRLAAPAVVVGLVQNLYSAAGTWISALGKIGALVSFAIRPVMWSGWKWVMTMVVTFSGSIPAFFQISFLTMLPAVGATWAPVPESNSTRLPPDLIAVTVNGMGTCSSVRPAAFSAALTSSSEAFLTKPGSCGFC